MYARYVYMYVMYYIGWQIIVKSKVIHNSIIISLKLKVHFAGSIVRAIARIWSPLHYGSIRLRQHGASKDSEAVEIAKHPSIFQCSRSDINYSYERSRK